MLALYPQAIQATAQGMTLVRRNVSNPAQIANGLNALQFFRHVATVATALAMPCEVEAMLVKVSEKVESMYRFPGKLLEQLYAKDSDDSTVDLHILCSDGATTIPAHRTIMSVASPYFGSLFGEHWSDAENGIWKSQVSPVVMAVIKKYIYIRDFLLRDLSEPQLQELFVVSHQYELLDLFHHCEQWLTRRLSLENFAALLVLSSERDEEAAELYAACLQFFQTHSTKLHFDLSFHVVKSERADVWSSLEASSLAFTSNGRGVNASGT